MPATAKNGIPYKWANLNGKTRGKHPNCPSCGHRICSVLAGYILGAASTLSIAHHAEEEHIRVLEERNYLKNLVSNLEDDLAVCLKENIMLKAAINDTRALDYCLGLKEENKRLWTVNYYLVDALENAVGKPEAWRIIDDYLGVVYNDTQQT